MKCFLIVAALVLLAGCATVRNPICLFNCGDTYNTGDKR